MERAEEKGEEYHGKKLIPMRESSHLFLSLTHPPYPS